MFKIGQANCMEDVNILFQIPTSLNGIKQYAYKLIIDDVDNSNLSPKKTIKVSGLDSNKPINCYFNIFDKLDNKHNSYVCSVFRMPYLIPEVLNHIKTNIVKVIISNYYEFWYIMSVKQCFESSSSISFKKLILNELEYNKTLLTLSGNVPVELLNAFVKKVSNKNNLHSLAMSTPVSYFNFNTITLKVVKDSSNESKSTTRSK
nr:Clas8 [Darna trima granulovirus]